MTDTEDYVQAMRRVCEQAKRTNPMDITLAVSSPSVKVDDKFTIARGVNGLTTLDIDAGLYDRLKSQLEPFMRKVLRDTMNSDGTRRVIEFYP